MAGNLKREAWELFTIVCRIWTVLVSLVIGVLLLGALVDQLLTDFAEVIAVIGVVVGFIMFFLGAMFWLTKGFKTP